LLLTGLLVRVLALLTRLILIGHLEISRWLIEVRDNSLDTPMFPGTFKFHFDHCAAPACRCGVRGTLPQTTYVQRLAALPRAVAAPGFPLLNAPSRRSACRGFCAKVWGCAFAANRDKFAENAEITAAHGLF